MKPIGLMEAILGALLTLCFVAAVWKATHLDPSPAYPPPDPAYCWVGSDAATEHAELCRLNVDTGYWDL
jgi:hypothetical protein